MRASLLSSLAALVLVSGCREDVVSPTTPESQPTLAAAATVPLTFIQVSAGVSHSCGVTTDHLAYCWGFGGLGNGVYQSLKPALVAGGLRFRHVSAGNAYSCGVTTDYRAYCWGHNNQGGQQGDGTTAAHSTPVAVAGGHLFRQVHAGGFHTCGVSYPDGRAYCWGENFAGELGDGTTAIRLLPTPVVGSHLFLQVNAGWQHTCGIATDNRGYCWGSNRYGQLGDSSEFLRRQRPVLVAGGHFFKEVSAGYQHTCALTGSGIAFCWGDGRNGQIGDGKTYLRFTPRRVTGGLRFEHVATGFFHSCAVAVGNRAYCWGWNATGALGNGLPPSNSSIPVAVAGGLSFSQVGGGEEHTCAVTTGGAAYCWGYNRDGEFGDGTTDSQSTPVPVAGPI